MTDTESQYVYGQPLRCSSCGQEIEVGTLAAVTEDAEGSYVSARHDSCEATL